MEIIKLDDINKKRNDNDNIEKLEIQNICNKSEILTKDLEIKNIKYEKEKYNRIKLRDIIENNEKYNDYQIYDIYKNMVKTVFNKKCLNCGKLLWDEYIDYKLYCHKCGIFIGIYEFYYDLVKNIKNYDISKLTYKKVNQDFGTCYQCPECNLRFWYILYSKYIENFFHIYILKCLNCGNSFGTIDYNEALYYIQNENEKNKENRCDKCESKYCDNFKFNKSDYVEKNQYNILSLQYEGLLTTQGICSKIFKNNLRNFIKFNFNIDDINKNESYCVNIILKTNKRKDVDNITKPILDSMSNLIYYDDTQVTNLNISKIKSKNEGFSLFVNKIE